MKRFCELPMKWPDLAVRLARSLDLEDRKTLLAPCGTRRELRR